MIKFIYDNQADIPEALRSHYQQNADGKWVLQCDGAISKTVHDEFRQNNITLAKERDALAAKFKDVDPEEYAKLKKNQKLLDEKELMTKDGVEALVNQRTATMKAELEGKVSSLTSDLEKSRNELGTLKIDGAVVQQGLKFGLKPEAQPDIIGRAKAIFRMDPKTGDVVALEPDGTPKYGGDGKPLKIEEWMKIAATDKSLGHLFTPNSGGGAAGSGRAGGAPNPFKTGNLTERAQLFRENPAEYARLAAEHAASAPSPAPMPAL